MQPRLMSGWIGHKKEEHERTMMGGAYNKRWAVLRGSILTLFSDQKEREPDIKAVLDLLQSDWVRVADVQKGNFCISHKGKTWKLKAEGSRCEEWVNALEEQMKKRPQVGGEAGPISKKLQTQLLAHTHFTAEDLTLFGEKFQELCNGGATLQAEGLRRAFQCRTDEPCVALDRLFQVLDRDKDGLVSVEEYVLVMEILTHGTTRAKSDFAFAVYDRGGQGMVTADDIRVVTRSILDVITQAYQDNGGHG